VHRDGASRGVVELELVPAITTTELADIFAWPQAVGITTSVHQDSWIIGLAAGEQGHLTITTPRWGPWRLTASLDGRPPGATIGRYGPAPVLSLGTEDVVRWLRIGD